MKKIPGLSFLLTEPERDLSYGAFLFLAIGLPLVLLGIHHDLGHHGDLQTFFDWYQAISQSNAFYRDAPGINYPILGVAAYVVPGWLVEACNHQPLDFETFRWVTKVTLVALEIGFTLMASCLARVSGISRPKLLAVGLYLLPSTWAGGAWFGQIDILGTLCLIVAAYGLYRFVLAAFETKRGILWLCLGLAGFHAAILCKQLTLFSVPGLLAMGVFGIAIRLNKNQGRQALGMTLGMLLSFSVLVLPDLGLTLPRGYFSHLQYVLFGGGSAHGDLISGNGANLWALIVEDPGESSLTPVFMGCSTKFWGLVLFFVYQIVLGGWLFREGRWLWLDQRTERERVHDALGCSLVYIGATNLAMATLLTGVHERYLVHGVPFLIIGTVVHARMRISFGRSLSWLTWLVGGWSGLFVLSSIHWEKFDGVLLPFRSHTLTGILELILLTTLTFHLWLGRHPDNESGLNLEKSL